jgi:steroid 5-alpha reductase family enzyme
MNHYLTLVILLFLYMTLWFGVALIKKRNDVADIAWGIGFVFISWCSLIISGVYAPSAIAVTVLVTIWGSRLSWHIYQRNKGKPEDYRYQEWREQWGKWFYFRSYLQVFLLQGLFLALIVFPVVFINHNAQQTLSLFDGLGFLVWVCGFVFESVGDAQLARFIKNPNNKGMLMQEGLWRYTRHPNYFGEVLQWWGVWLYALSIPSGWVTIIGPLTITFLILKVSGIPLLEKKMEANPLFKEYKKKTSMFFPLPPKKL